MQQEKKQTIEKYVNTNFCTFIDNLLEKFNKQDEKMLVLSTIENTITALEDTCIEYNLRKAKGLTP